MGLEKLVVMGYLKKLDVMGYLRAAWLTACRCQCNYKRLYNSRVFREVASKRWSGIDTNGGGGWATIG